MELYDYAAGRIKVLEGFLQLLDQRRICKPDEIIHVKSNQNKREFYFRKNGKDTYVNKKGMPKAMRIAQYEYDEKARKAIEAELEALCDLSMMDSVANVYDEFHPLKRRLIKPLCLSDEEFVKQWNDEKYEGVGFAEEDESEFYTARGERVRSKSEMMIADALDRKGLPYRYEYPIRLGRVKVHPDFMILDVKNRKEYLWEHLGMLDDAEYLEWNLKKIKEYMRSEYFLGENLIITGETRKQPLSTKDVNMLIDRFFLR